MAQVRFRFDKRWIEPFAIAPLAVAETPDGFDIVKAIDASPNGISVQITSEPGQSISVNLEVSFLAPRPMQA
jgi:hypothetical protein